MKVLILTSGDESEIHTVFLRPITMTSGDLATLQIICEEEYNQGLKEIEVEEPRDYFHLERMIRNMNGS
jgi:hypothetical protein